MSKRSREAAIAEHGRSGRARSSSASGSEDISDISASPTRRLLPADDRKRVDWPTRSMAPGTGSVVIIEKKGRDPAQSIPGRKNNGYGLPIPFRPDGAGPIDGKSLDPMNPNSLSGKRPEERNNTYPPIITIDGRVDTDLDHLIEDDDDDDEDYDGPVDDVPSRYPKPHVFSVIHGSLDDDVDSYANDDGTMEHTLVDAPKNFHPRDLKDVASTDISEGRTRPGQVNGAGAGSSRGQRAIGGGVGSHLMSYTDRSHNKMNIDGCENPKEEKMCLTPKQHLESQWQRHHPQTVSNQINQTGGEGQINCDKDKTAAPNMADQIVHAATNPMNTPPTGHAYNDGSLDKIERFAKEDSIRYGNVKDQSAVANAAQHAFESVARVRQHMSGQPSPGRSISEQTHKSEDFDLRNNLRRHVSCTLREIQQSGRSSPRRYGTKASRNELVVSDSNDDHTFITCRESFGMSSGRVGLSGRHHLSNSRSSNRGSPVAHDSARRNFEGERIASCSSSITGLDSIKSEEFCVERPQPCYRDERYSSDPPVRCQSPFLSEVVACKSETRTPSPHRRQEYLDDAKIKRYLEEGKRLKSRTTHGQNNGPVCDSVEWYENRKPSRRRTSKSPNADEQYRYYAKSKTNSDKYASTKMQIYRAVENEQLSKQPPGEYWLQSQHLLNRHQNHKYTRRGSKKRHPGNTIWQGTEGFRPIEPSEKGAKLKRVVRSNQEFTRVRNSTPSPVKNNRRVSPRRSKERKSKYEDDWAVPHWDRTSKRHLEGNTKRKVIQARTVNEGYILDPAPYQLAQNAWLSAESMWQEGRWKSPQRSGKTKQQRKVSHRALKSRQLNIQPSPHASWSYDSCRSLVKQQRKHSRMLPYKRKKLSDSEREFIARTIGTSVDDAESLQHTQKRLIKTLDMSSTEDDIKQSLQQAMAIARESLTAAARVSKALNLVLTSSGLSSASCSVYGSCADASSPRIHPQSPAERMLRWSPQLRHTSVSSHYTDMTAVSSHPPPPPAPPSPVSQLAVSPVQTRLPRINQNVSSPELYSRRPQSIAVSNMDHGQQAIPAPLGPSGRPPGKEYSAPLVSIFIGAPNGTQSEQQPTQVAQIFSSHVQRSISNITALPQHTRCNSSPSLPWRENPKESQLTDTKQVKDTTQPTETKMCNSLNPYQNALGDNTCTLLKDFDIHKLHQSAIKEQTICVNAVTKVLPCKMTSNSADSQCYESTCEETCHNMKTKSKRHDNAYKMTTSELSTLKGYQTYKGVDYDDIPTHEDGSSPLKEHRVRESVSSAVDGPMPFTKRNQMDCNRMIPGDPSILRSPLGLTEKVTSSLASLTASPDHIPSPESRAAMISEALSYLALNCSATSHGDGSGFLLYPDQISPPRSEERDVWIDCEEPHASNVTNKVVSECIESPVDPSAYLPDGSAVDPPNNPNRFTRSNANGNKSDNPRSSTTGRSCLQNHSDVYLKYEHDTLTEENIMSKYITDEQHNESQHSSNQTNQGFRLQETSTAHLPQGVSIESKHDDFVNSSKSNQWQQKSGPSQVCRSDNNLTYEYTSLNQHRTIGEKELFQHTEYFYSRYGMLDRENGNNNSSGGNDMEMHQRGWDRDDEMFTEDDLQPDTLHDEEGDLMLQMTRDRNHNKLRTRSRRGPLEEQELARALHLLSKDRARRDRGILTGQGARPKRERSQRRQTKKTLNVAVKLARESLSAAAKVTELLNQVVDVYQCQHPEVDSKITKLHLPEDMKNMQLLKQSLPHVSSPSAGDQGATIHVSKAQANAQHIEHEENKHLVYAQIDEEKIVRRLLEEIRKQTNVNTGEQIKKEYKENPSRSESPTHNKKTQVKLCASENDAQFKRYATKEDVMEKHRATQRPRSPKKGKTDAPNLQEESKQYVGKTIRDCKDRRGNSPYETGHFEEDESIFRKKQNRCSPKMKRNHRPSERIGAHQERACGNQHIVTKNCETKLSQANGEKNVYLQNKGTLENSKANKTIEELERRVKEQNKDGTEPKRSVMAKQKLSRKRADNDIRPGMPNQEQDSRFRSEKITNEEVPDNSIKQEQIEREKYGTSVDLPRYENKLKVCHHKSLPKSWHEFPDAPEVSQERIVKDQRKKRDERRKSPHKRGTHAANTSKPLHAEDITFGSENCTYNIASMKDPERKCMSNQSLAAQFNNTSSSQGISQIPKTKDRRRQRSRSNPRDERSGTSPSTEQSIYKAVIKAFSKNGDDPESQAGCGNYSFNRSLEYPNYHVDKPCGPYKHKYPACVDTTQQLLHDSGQLETSSNSDSLENPIERIENAWCESNNDTDCLPYECSEITNMPNLTAYRKRQKEQSAAQRDEKYNHTKVLPTVTNKNDTESAISNDHGVKYSNKNEIGDVVRENNESEYNHLEEFRSSMHRESLESPEKSNCTSKEEDDSSDFPFFSDSARANDDFAYSRLGQWRTAASPYEENDSSSEASSSSEDEDTDDGIGDDDYYKYYENYQTESTSCSSSPKKLECFSKRNRRHYPKYQIKTCVAVSPGDVKDATLRPVYAILKRENSFHMSESPVNVRQHSERSNSQPPFQTIGSKYNNRKSQDSKNEHRYTTQWLHEQANNPGNNTVNGFHKAHQNQETSSLDESAQSFIVSEDGTTGESQPTSDYSPLPPFFPRDSRDRSRIESFYNDIEERGEAGAHQLRQSNFSEVPQLNQSNVETSQNERSARQQGWHNTGTTAADVSSSSKKSFAPGGGQPREVPTPNGRGLYPLYRPLDNMKQMSFSPIIEESEIMGLSERLSSSCVYNITSAVEKSSNKCNNNNNSNNNNNNRYWDIRNRTSRITRSGSKVNKNCWKRSDINKRSIYDQRGINLRDMCSDSQFTMDECLNSNNNASRQASTTSSIGKHYPEIDPEASKTTKRVSKQYRRSRSYSVEPIPFIHRNRIPLPQITPPVPIPRAKPLNNMTEYQQWKLQRANSKLAKSIIEVQRAGCTFDTGLKKKSSTRQQLGNSRTPARVWMNEAIAKENQKLFERIVNKEPFYKREEQLNAYDKMLPKLLSFSKYPEALIKLRNLEFK